MKKCPAKYTLYEPLIARIVANWPQPTIISPDERTVGTLNTQLRYAIQAFLQMPHLTAINHDQLSLVAKAMVISKTKAPGKLWVGPADAVPAKQLKVALEVQGELTADALQKLLAFLNTGCGQSVTLCTDLPVEQMATKFANVAVVALGGGTYRIF